MAHQARTVYSKEIIEAMHRTTGGILRVCNRVIASVMVLGSIFMVLMMVSVQLAQHPEQVFHMQAFTFNYGEFARAQAADVHSAVATARQTVLVHPRAAVRDLKKDPNWDGTLAGAGVGLTVGRTIPFIGPIVGPIAGAMLGYRLDSQI